MSEFTEPGPKTSCFQIVGSQSTPWFQVYFKSASFDSNKGTITNEIYFDAIVTSLVIEECTFSIDISTLAIGKRA